MTRVPASERTRELASRVAIDTRHHPEADRTELVRALNASRATDWARSIAEAAPPLTDAQRVAVVRIILGAS